LAKTTAILIIILAIIAALVTGIQIGRKVGSGSLFTSSPTPDLTSQAPSPSVIASASAQLQTFTHKECGVQFQYDPAYQVSQSSNSAILVNGTTGDQVSLACAAEIPLPPLPPEKIDEATVAGQAATIYHDASAKDGTPIDVVIFDHPVKGLKVALLGFGEVFQQTLTSIKIQ